jgi:hypothetical protein
VTGDEVRRVPGAAHISCTVEMAPVVVGSSVQVPRASEALQQRLMQQQDRTIGWTSDAGISSSSVLGQGFPGGFGDAFDGSAMLSALQHSRGFDSGGLPGRGDPLGSQGLVPPLLPGQQHSLQQTREVQGMKAAAAAGGATAPLVGLGSARLPWAGQPSLIDVAVIDEIQVLTGVGRACKARCRG